MPKLPNISSAVSREAATADNLRQIDLHHHEPPKSLTVLTRMPRSNVYMRGVTLVELITVVAIMAILLAVAVPSFTGLLSKKRVEGALMVLATDLQYARSEAVQRNASVRMTFGAGCYVIHTVGSTATSCTQSGAATIGTGAVQLKKEFGTGPQVYYVLEKGAKA